jgi:DGQHR domain-containing protein
MPMQSIRVQKFRQMHDGEPVDLYLGALPAVELLARTRIAVFDPETKEGYQRAATETRMREISRYIQKQEGMLPTAALVNIRQGAHFVPDGYDNFGCLEIDTAEPFWVIDGQHRIGGLRLAYDQVRKNPAASLNYDVPVVFCLDFEQAAEMDLFLIVNSKAKSVPTDLTAELIHDRVRNQLAENPDARPKLNELLKHVGVDVAHYLTEQPGPWYNRIRLANELKSDVKRKPMQVNTVASSLQPVLRERWVEGLYSDPNDLKHVRLGRVVHTYWSALAELMPEAFADIEKHAVQRPIGVYSFHKLLPDVLERCRRKGSFSQSTFHTLLEPLEEWVSSRTWQTVPDDIGDPLVHANNRQSIELIVRKMRVLFGIETPELPD